MRIGIIGGGISGLSAAWALGRLGHDVTVYERGPEIGGLIATFDFDGIRVERFYHFLCKGDEGYFQLCRELGIDRRIVWRKPRTGFYFDGHLHSFTNPLDLLRFHHIPLSQRLRFGLLALEARWKSEWRQLDRMPGKEWLIDRIGLRAYEVIWHPLLQLKFGHYHDRISAAWVWHRLHRVSRSKGALGYLDGGSALLLDTLAEALPRQGVRLVAGTGIERICCDGGRVAGLQLEGGAFEPFDRVVSTVPLPVVAGLLPDEHAACRSRLERIAYIGVVCIVFRLRTRCSPYFWLNIHDPAVPFNGFIEFTNHNPISQKAGHIVYIPTYIPVDSPFYRMDDDALRGLGWDALQRVNPRLDAGDLLDWRVFRARWAQAICPVGFLDLLPPQDGPVEGLHLLDSAFIYPEDRSQSALILNANALARRIGPAAP